jgi:transcriptional antiterminator RfaH
MALHNEGRWFVVHTRPHAERCARDQLSAQGFHVFLPQYLRKCAHAGRVAHKARPLFPRYLFVEIDRAVQRWRCINGTIGVSRLLGTDEGPTPIASCVVEELLRRRDENGLIALAADPHFALGDKVRILGGAFASVLGLFEGFADRDRVLILVDLLGRKVRVTLDETDIEQAA